MKRNRLDRTFTKPIEICQNCVKSLYVSTYYCGLRLPQQSTLLDAFGDVMKSSFTCLMLIPGGCFSKAHNGILYYLRLT
jgi:uncharacterized protein (UPF0303 family)